jgi:hypothetical protein
MLLAMLNRRLPLSVSLGVTLAIAMFKLKSFSVVSATPTYTKSEMSGV